jgi:diaminohydroxyphosphoribosylaminopyrimidine deaminase/5-amino-6-(5-phosphoribosylamino)uracil reductase
MALSPLDRQRLHEALGLAQDACGRTEPNPRVGCIIGFDDGRVLGRGATQHAGGPHAEVVALADAAGQPTSTHGATAWVTLEPCAHHGRTPPCADALIASGIARCVVAVGDPFPAVDGAGIRLLRSAGITVELADEAIAEAARELNIGFFSRVRRARPWVRLKVAASLDGRTALADGSSQWITGPDARTDGHAWRRRAGAILSGIGTVQADNPRLDVRLVPSPGQPLRVVVDSQLRLPLGARLLAPPGRVLIVAAAQGDAIAKRRQEALQAAGADILVLPPDAGGHVDLHALLSELARRGVNELHVEAGPRLNGALLQAGLVDELLLYLAPRLLGPGRDLAALPALAKLTDSLDFEFIDCTQVGADLRLRLRPPGRADF